MRKTIGLIALATAFNHQALGADASEIMAVDRAFSHLSTEKGVAAAFDHYLAKDATKLDGGAHAVTGHDQIMQGFAGLPEGTTLEWWPQDGRVAASEDLAYTWGVYELHYTLAGEAKVSYGKYTTIWAKEDGDWKAVLDIGNASPGPAPQ